MDRQYILYLLLDNGNNDCHTIRSPYITITIVRGDIGYLFTGFCGQRYNKIYIDSALNIKRNEEAINCMLKPMCIPYGGELIFI